MSDKPPESPHLLRSALDRVLVHDIKNMGFRLQMLLSNVDEHYGDPGFKRAVEELLRTTVERLDGMVERFSAHEDALLIKVALDLNSIVREVADGTTRRDVPKAGGHSRAPLSLALGEPPEIWGDPYYLTDALASLVENALEATPPEGKVLVRTFSEETGRSRRAVVEIIDNGSGIPADFVRDRLFQPFQTTKSEGVGLGLATASQIVRIHGGAIRLLSEPGGGTVVRLTFPGVSKAESEPETS